MICVIQLIMHIRVKTNTRGQKKHSSPPATFAFEAEPFNMEMNRGAAWLLNFEEKRQEVKRSSKNQALASSKRVLVVCVVA